MTQKTKIVRTIYLYVVALLSLLFLTIGLGNLINTTLKAYAFPEAEKRDYNVCYHSYFYPMTEIEKIKNIPLGTEEQQIEINNIINEYNSWKEQNTGDNCYKAERQKRIVDALTMIFVSLPLYIFHWRLIRKEKKES